VPRSAGILLYRRRTDGLEVFLVHPGGPFWRNKDEGSWSIPKGQCGETEEPFDAAVREFAEETGLPISGTFVALQEIRQNSGKRVIAWALEGDADPEAIRSNTFSLEYPQRSGQFRDFPEVDRAAWFPISLARQKILKGQLPLLDQLERIAGSGLT
jgi:predicted NUDIX family NTP pyrophosphohydrolase